MKIELLTLGKAGSPVVVIDGFSNKAGHIREIAAALAPFPPAGTYYPGVRRIISGADTAAHAYASDVLRDIAPIITDAFDIDSFDPLEASFSMVTQTPDHLTAQQRAPHFDDTDPNYLAILHYLSASQGSGTAFYRHRATGIERVTADNMQALITMLKLESPHWPKTGYITGSNEWFEQIGEIEACSDRLAIYQGALLHSGIIPSDMFLSDDPLTGRLTANLFIRGK